MTKLWAANHQSNKSFSCPLDRDIHNFLAGKDIELDQELLPFDIKASKAHANALQELGILTANENDKIQHSLTLLLENYLNGTFTLNPEFEDCHSAIEFYLTEQLGDLGKKIHTGRSRNDQVLVASRLYCKDQLLELNHINQLIAKTCLQQAKHNQNIPMPGYSHLQQAVISSWGMWFAAFAESFIDNIDYTKKMIDWIDANPLGTAAGFGVNLCLNRTMTSEQLGFKRMQINPIYSQNSRGKFELSVLSCFKNSMFDVRKIAWDLSLFSMQELNYIKQSDRYTTGSSIMPNKRNPDVIELLRASYSKVHSAYQELESLLSLPSGYHRDLQFTKKPLIHGINDTLSCLALVPEMVEDITINKNACMDAINIDMYKTDLSIEYAVKGIPFRAAYQEIKYQDLSPLGFSPEDSINKRVSPGACANLMLVELEKRLQELSN